MQKLANIEAFENIGNGNSLSMSSVCVNNGLGFLLKTGHWSPANYYAKADRIDPRYYTYIHIAEDKKLRDEVVKKRLKAKDALEEYKQAVRDYNSLMETRIGEAQKMFYAPETQRAMRRALLAGVTDDKRLTDITGFDKEYEGYKGDVSESVNKGLKDLVTSIKALRKKEALDGIGSLDLFGANLWESDPYSEQRDKEISDDVTYKTIIYKMLRDNPDLFFSKFQDVKKFLDSAQGQQYLGGNSSQDITQAMFRLSGAKNNNGNQGDKDNKNNNGSKDNKDNQSNNGSKSSKGGNQQRERFASWD